MARIYWLGIVAALTGCGEAVAPPPIAALPWFASGAPVTLSVYMRTTYDCAPETFPSAPDPDLCGNATGTVALREDTVQLAGTFDSVGTSILGAAGSAFATGTYVGCPLQPTPACVLAEVQDTLGVVVMPSPASDSLLIHVSFRFDIATGAINQSISAILLGAPTSDGASGSGLPALGDGPTWLFPRQSTDISWFLCGSC